MFIPCPGSFPHIVTGSLFFVFFVSATVHLSYCMHKMCPCLHTFIRVLLEVCLKHLQLQRVAPKQARFCLSAAGFPPRHTIFCFFEDDLTLTLKYVPAEIALLTPRKRFLLGVTAQSLVPVFDISAVQYVCMYCKQ